MPFGGFRRGPAIHIDRAAETRFYIDPVKFARRVIAKIENDFSHYENADPPLPTVAPSPGSTLLATVSPLLGTTVVQSGTTALAGSIAYKPYDPAVTPPPKIMGDWVIPDTQD